MLNPSALFRMSSWDRRDDESEKDFVAFKAYRDQSPPRNVKRTSANLVDHTFAQCIELCNKFDWRERVKEYDAYLDSVLQAEREEFLKQDVRRRTAEHMSLLKDARDFLAREIRKMLKWSDECEVGVIQPQLIPKLMDSVIKLERLVAGESTENTNQTFDLSGLTQDELRQAYDLLNKAGVSGLGALTPPGQGAKKFS